MSITKRRIFIDMDGVLAVFHPEKSLEEIAEPGYFRMLEAQEQVVDAISKLSKSRDTEIFILSAVLNDTAAAEKDAWIEEYLPEIDSQNLLFVPYGKDKSDYVREITGEISTDDILIDDFTLNLQKWHGVGIKLLNRINNTNRTWDGFVVNGNASASVIYSTIQGITMVA